MVQGLTLILRKWPPMMRTKMRPKIVCRRLLNDEDDNRWFSSSLLTNTSRDWRKDPTKGTKAVLWEGTKYTATYNAWASEFWRKSLNFYIFFPIFTHCCLLKNYLFWQTQLWANESDKVAKFFYKTPKRANTTAAYIW